MAEGTLGAAAAAMSGSLVGGSPEVRWSGASLDSRQVRGGELFFALPGERTDGHRFVGDALGRGAAAAVVERRIQGSEGPLIRVDDSFEALHALTRDVRRRTPRRLLAITGSTGKTTTKELAAAMLSRRFRVARNPGNLNNLYGFPVALLGIPEDTEWMVAEMGMSEPGELGRVARLGRPDAVLLTNIRPVHLEFFGTLEAIAAAKAEILEGLVTDGLVVANVDDPQLVRILSRHPGRIVWYGLAESADVTWEDVEQLSPVGTRFRLRCGADSVRVELPLFGSYNVVNFVAAAACARELGVPLEEIAASASSARPEAMRGVFHTLPGEVTLIDDSYNANPEAVALALESAAELPARRRWAVLGEMLELGERSAEFHREAGERAARLGFSPIVAVGEGTRALAQAARQAGAETEWVADAAGAAERAVEMVAAGDLVLVKGSRGVGLDAVVERIRSARSGEAD